MECNITDLPAEVLTLILGHCEAKDLISFSSTCKDFRNLVHKKINLLWKKIFRPMLPSYAFKSLEKNNDGDWCREFKEYNFLKHIIYKELISTSTSRYWYAHTSLEDVRSFFYLALSRNVNYFYVIYILQDVVRKANMYIDSNISKKPFTMTEMFYAKLILQHITHTFLAVKWVRNYMKKELPPETVINFFLQWVDLSYWHPDEEVNIKLNELAEMVKKILNDEQPRWASYSIKERIAMKVLHEKQVLTTVSKLLYQKINMHVEKGTVSLDMLKIIKVLEYDCVNFITAAVIYQAVAARCGVECDLVAFPNHLFVEWRDNSDPRLPVIYVVDLQTGHLRPKRQCPFISTHYCGIREYCPETFVLYIISRLDQRSIRRVGIMEWYLQNVTFLQSFLQGRRENNPVCPYRNFFTYLLERTHLPAMNIPLDITNLQIEQIRLITDLANLNPSITLDEKREVSNEDKLCEECFNLIIAEIENNPHTPEQQVGHNLICVNCGISIAPRSGRRSRPLLEGNPERAYIVELLYPREFVQKKRTSDVMYAIGMVCRHKQLHHDVGVIRDWHESWDSARKFGFSLSSQRIMEKNLKYLQLGSNQPFYFVVKNNKVCRYVAQEDVVELTSPTRLCKVEDTMAQEFTHFDGFAYVPNEQKRAEYPDDPPVVEVYRTRDGLKP